MPYNPKKIESKWQKYWEKSGIFRAEDFSKKPKLYLLVEFPYPSGEGLHVGHCRSYTALDVAARKKRMEGFNVLFPMGWDAFGLPTENYAIKTGIHPQIATKRNTAFFKRQQTQLGLSFDWSREINTTDPAYYKWTQWIFLQMWKKGLAYKSKMSINWCPSCKIGLANEEVVDGGCERCGNPVERREKEQWMLKITQYAERLIKDLDKVDYPERVKVQQKEWIGKSDGWEVKFLVANSELNIPVFTTRIDTLFGCTYLVISPELPILENLKSNIKNLKSLEEYIKKSKDKPERDRAAEAKKKTGVRLEGVAAINPATGKEIPIFVADYVLANYGTGAIMAVPAHDQRDFEFAKIYSLPIKIVICPNWPKPVCPVLDKAYEGEGFLIDSDRFSGLKSEIARERIGEFLAKKGMAKKAVYYKLRDWIFSRQRYWGEPIPMVNCPKCARSTISGQGWQPLPEKDLPLELPRVAKYQPTETGESPLARAKNWVNAKCPKCGGKAQRETDVMPNWAGSNWYYLAYLMRGISNFQFPRPTSPKDEVFGGQARLPTPDGVAYGGQAISKYKEIFKYWMPVDWYNGGMEHTTLHLLYSRFVYKFLWDIGAVPKSLGPEPYKKRTSHGMVLGEGGVKMSKSRGNVVNPQKIISQYGADALRLYEMFMGPFAESVVWDSKGVIGVRRFLDKVWKLSQTAAANPKQKSSGELKKILHQTIKKVSEDIDSLKFNTAVSSLMEFANAWQKNKEGLGGEESKNFLKILSPFAPHMAEELWLAADKASGAEKLSSQQYTGIFSQSWPKYDSKLIAEKTFALIIQVNGRVRDQVEAPMDISEAEAKQTAQKREKIQKWLAGKQIKKVIFVPGKLINFVVS